MKTFRTSNFCPRNEPSEAYNIFYRHFVIYTMSLFQKKEIEIKSKYLNRPWITKGIRKSSKCKQRLYERYLKI